MSDPERADPGDLPFKGDTAIWAILVFLLMLIGSGVLTYAFLRRPAPPPPPAVAQDPLLMEGRSVYLARCATCHGPEGRADGPIAGSLLGPPVGNLSQGPWKHGDRPDQVMAVISRGVPGTRMSGWGEILEESALRAVTAYVYYLAGKPVPNELRASVDLSY